MSNHQIVPVEGKGKEGKMLYNGEKLKLLDEILPEMAIAQYGKLFDIFHMIL